MWAEYEAQPHRKATEECLSPRALAGLRYGALTGTPVHKENTAFSVIESFRPRPDTTPLEMAPAYSSCLLFGLETHASTTQSDPLLLPTRNGPCREDRS